MLSPVRLDPANGRRSTVTSSRPELSRAEGPRGRKVESMNRLTTAQVEAYKDDGYLVVEDVLNSDVMAQLGSITDAFVDRARAAGGSDDVFDFEPPSKSGEQHLRRVKSPERQAAVYAGVMQSDAVLDCVSDLIGGDVRFWSGKLNLKRPLGGQAVEWHQDWAFGPATNDDLLTVGIALDDATTENGCLLMIPGSHRGPVLDHWRDEKFAGAVTDEAFDSAAAVPVEVKCGGVSIHHIRTLHASAPNRSDRQRRLLLYTYAAADAWPLAGVAEPDAFNTQMVRGTAALEPRLEKVPVRRWPRWENEKLGSATSIFDLQERVVTSAFS
jgi:phytanoyl-CoA hydroxylase